MWLLTTSGFYSVVSAGDGKRVQVRARRRDDLERLVTEHAVGEPIIETFHADYPFRMLLPYRVWDRVASELAREPRRYPKFKPACPPDLYATYVKVWELLLELEREGEHGCYGRDDDGRRERGAYEPWDDEAGRARDRCAACGCDLDADGCCPEGHCPDCGGHLTETTAVVEPTTRYSDINGTTISTPSYSTRVKACDHCEFVVDLDERTAIKNRLPKKEK
jgi:hypothetical protein